MSKFFHLHAWQDESWTFNPSRVANFRIPEMRISEAAFEDLLSRFEEASHGFTTLLQRCSGCGDVRVRRFTGRVAPANSSKNTRLAAGHQ